MSELCGLVKLSSQFAWEKRYQMISDLLLLHLEVKENPFLFIPLIAIPPSSILWSPFLDMVR